MVTGLYWPLIQKSWIKNFFVKEVPLFCLNAKKAFWLGYFPKVILVCKVGLAGGH